MSYNAELRPDGQFTFTNSAGHVLLDGVFRRDIPESMRLRLLTELTEAPAMLATLKLSVETLGALQRELSDKLGGIEAAQAQAPWLFRLIEALDDQIASASPVGQ